VQDFAAYFGCRAVAELVVFGEYSVQFVSASFCCADEHLWSGRVVFHA